MSWTISRFLQMVEDEGIESLTRALGDGRRTRVGDVVLYHGDDGFRFAVSPAGRIDTLDEVAELVGVTPGGILTETVTTTTANVAGYQIPIGIRVDDFIKRYGRKADDEGSGHLLKRKF